MNTNKPNKQEEPNKGKKKMIVKSVRIFPLPLLLPLLFLLPTKTHITMGIISATSIAIITWLVLTNRIENFSYQNYFGRISEGIAETSRKVKVDPKFRNLLIFAGIILLQLTLLFPLLGIIGSIVAMHYLCVSPTIKSSSNEIAPGKESE